MDPLDPDNTKNQVILILKYYLYKCRSLGDKPSINDLSKQTFCNITLKFQTPRTVSNGNHFLHIYSLCVEVRKFMVVFSILMQYFRYFRPPFVQKLEFIASVLGMHL
jgi:hypothetical protein